MYSYDFETENYNNIRDGLYGVVEGNSRSGVFLTLENGEPAYAKFGYLQPGQKVFCTVLKKATDQFRTFVSVDSIIYEPLVA